MNRHAAALALVGWSLVAPFKGQNLDSGGYILGDFKTQDQCEKRKAEVRKPGFKSPDVPLNADLAGATCKSYQIGNQLNEWKVRH
jgi:hypothetical protein